MNSPNDQMDRSTPAPITCHDSVRMVSALRDDDLSTTDVVRLEHHLAHCPSCQVARQQFAVLFSALNQWFEKQP
jgi:predicted anti-sigma-YlaC factor YlaD